MEAQTELLQNIEKAIRDVLNNPTLNIGLESKLVDDLGLESIDMLDVSSELENSIGRELDFKEVAEFVKNKNGAQANIKSVSVKDLIDFIETTH